MKKSTLIEYIKGVTPPSVSEKVEEWIMQDTAHLNYFTRLKDEYLCSTMPGRSASPGQMQIARDIMDRPVPHRWRYVATSFAAAILIALVLNICYMYYLHNSSPTDSILPAARIQLGNIPTSYTHTIYTNKGTKSEITLPDGSTVKLNSDTKIIFPDRFIGPTREIFITGEAFFDVKSNPDTPMIVNTGKEILVRVLGTKFNIRAYKNENSAKATLYSGKIDVLKKSKSREPLLMATLKPNESIELRELKAPLKVLKADTLKLAAWTRGDLIFDVTPLESVLKELERWHGAKFTVKNSDIYKYSFSAKFKQESLVQILEVLKFCTGIDYTIEGNNVILE